MRKMNDKEKDKLKSSTLEYIGISDDDPRKKIFYKCKKHGLISQRFDVHIKYLICSKCSKLKDGIYTLEYMNKLKEKRDVKYIYDVDKNKKYTAKDKIKIICDKHGTFEQTIHNHFNIGNNCPICSRPKKIEINKEIEILLNNKLIKIIKFNGYRKKSTFSCNKHGEFKSHIGTVKIHGCCQCAMDNKMMREKKKFINNSISVWGDLIKFDYDTLEYNGSGKKMKLFSKQIGWLDQLPNNHLSGFIPKKSTGEVIIENLLNIKNIKFNKEMKFDECMNIRHLRFDFYIPEIKTCIEYNGSQHYKPIDFFGGEKTYLYQLKNDNIKKEFCEKNGIDLIVIPYNESIIEKLKEIYVKFETK